MKGEALIVEALGNYWMEPEEARACEVWRGYSWRDDQTGWLVNRFGSSEVTFLGTTVEEALSTIKERAREE